MPLVALADVSDLLVCPRCTGPLAGSVPRLTCADEACGLSASSFPVVGDTWPALIDFEKSVVDPSGLRVPSVGAETRREGTTARLKRLVRPVNRVAARNVSTLERMLLGPGPLVLVIGGGTIGNGASTLYESGRLRVLGFDIYASEHVQLLADAHQIPLASGSVDAVVVQAVLEHVLDPWRVVEEIHRVLRPEGLVYSEMPFMQQVHAGPYDFTRFTDSGHRWLFRSFSQVDRGVVAGPGTAMSWSIDHLGRSLFRSRDAGRAARLAFFWVRLADRMSSGPYAVDSASAFYFLGTRSTTRISAHEIIADYAGAQPPAPPIAGRGGGAPRLE